MVAARRMHSFCSLFDPRFRLASSRTAGARLRAPLHRGAMQCVQIKALLVDGTRGKRAIYRSNEEQRSVKREGGSRSETEGLSRCHYKPFFPLSF